MCIVIQRWTATLNKLLLRLARKSTNHWYTGLCFMWIVRYGGVIGAELKDSEQQQFRKWSITHTTCNDVLFSDSKRIDGTMTVSDLAEQIVLAGLCIPDVNGAMWTTIQPTLHTQAVFLQPLYKRQSEWHRSKREIQDGWQQYQLIQTSAQPHVFTGLPHPQLISFLQVVKFQCAIHVKWGQEYFRVALCTAHTKFTNLAARRHLSVFPEPN